MRGAQTRRRSRRSAVGAFAPRNGGGTVGGFKDPNAAAGSGVSVPRPPPCAFKARAFCPPPRSASKRAFKSRKNAGGASGRTCKTREGGTRKLRASRRMSEGMLFPKGVFSRPPRFKAKGTTLKNIIKADKKCCLKHLKYKASNRLRTRPY